MKKYTYYARDAQGALTPIFSLFWPQEPPVDEVTGFMRQVMAQTRTLSMPRPTHFTVEELHEFPASEEGDVQLGVTLAVPGERTVH